MDFNFFSFVIEFNIFSQFRKTGKCLERTYTEFQVKTISGKEEEEEKKEEEEEEDDEIFCSCASPYIQRKPMTNKCYTRERHILSHITVSHKS